MACMDELSEYLVGKEKEGLVLLTITNEKGQDRSGPFLYLERR